MEWDSLPRTFRKAIAGRYIDSGLACNPKRDGRKCDLEVTVQKAAFDFEKVIQPLLFFNGRICHDLNNLITGGMGAMAILEHKCRNQDLHHLQPELDRLNQAIDEFSAFTHKLEALFWAGEGEKIRFDLARIVEIEVAQVQSSQHPIRFDGTPVMLMMDGESMAGAVRALLQNAREAMPDGGPIDVTLKSDGSDVVLEVVDTGCGIEAHHMEQVFNPFFSVTKRGNLVGWGLSYAGIVVARHGGQISIHSAPGKGTRVSVRFPGS